MPQRDQIIQTLDTQQRCSGVYVDDKFYKEPSSEYLNGFHLAWRHSPLLDDLKYEYMFVLLRGSDLSEYSPDKSRYQACKRLMEAQAKAAKTAQIDMTGECFFDIVPQHLLEKWFFLRNESLVNLRSLNKPGSDYDILHKAHVLTTNISTQQILFKNQKKRVLYNIFGSATGRLTTKKGSVPVMTLKKDHRQLLRPSNDAFVELDLNAAEIRMLMALSGQDQPTGDIHEWVVENVFNNAIERSQAKIELFAWLYNPSNSKSRFDQIFSREIFRDFYFSDSKILATPFGRKLSVEERKAQNYLLQSTTSDQVLENAYKIQKMLKGKRTTIAFTLHDSIILDMAKEDAIMLQDIKSQFENTRWGKFMSTCKIGKNFGNLKEFKF